MYRIAIFSSHVYIQIIIFSYKLLLILNYIINFLYKKKTSSLSHHISSIIILSKNITKQLKGGDSYIISENK